MRNSAFPNYHITVYLLALVWFLFAALCMYFGLAIRRHRLQVELDTEAR